MITPTNINVEITFEISEADFMDLLSHLDNAVNEFNYDSSYVLSYQRKPNVRSIVFNVHIAEKFEINHVSDAVNNVSQLLEGFVYEWLAEYPQIVDVRTSVQ